MALGDFSVHGIHSSQPVRVAASATRGYAGEPVVFGGTYTNGVASANTVVVAADATPAIGTDNFVGVLNKSMEVNSAGTVLAHRNIVSRPIPNATRIRGRAKTSTTADTLTEVIGLLFDYYLIDLTSSTYTLDAAGADTAAFTCVDGNPAKATLDVIVDARGLRVDIS